MPPTLEIAVVGATGVVGREVLSALQERGYPAEHVTALASNRSEQVELDYGDETLAVEKATPDSFRGIQLAFFATPPDVSRVMCPAAQAAGAWAIDVSSAFRGDAQIPLIAPTANLSALRTSFRGKIVASASPIASLLVGILEPLRSAFGVERTVVTALVSASSQGTRGVAELESQAAGLLSGQELEATRFPHRLGFNLIPHVGEALAGSPWTSEEESWSQELRRIWPDDAPVVFGTAVQVPIFYGHAASLAIELKRSATLESVRELLKASPALKLLDAVSERIYPMPMLVTADPTVHVGRVRVIPGAHPTVLLFAAVDNAGRGAALNAVEIGEALVSRQ